jgi:hypothetical protein
MGAMGIVAGPVYRTHIELVEIHIVVSNAPERRGMGGGGG